MSILNTEQKSLTSVRREVELVPQTDRVFLHVDADCFYAQVEEIRNPDLRHVPLGVTQKYLVVTCNYHARERGVRKLMGIAEAKRVCPGIRLVNGEDLTPYREYSDAVAEVLQAYGPIKKLGCDEMFVDVTEEARRRSSAGASWKGHVFIPSDESVVESESSLRIMDLRARRVPGDQTNVAGDASPSAPLLKAGSEIAWEARRAIQIAVGVRTSAGIAHSMLIAKLISGLHKPDDQTILLAEHAREFVGPLPVRALMNVGSVLQRNLKEHGIVYVSDMWEPEWSRQRLVATFGERHGNHLYFASKGQDHIQTIENQWFPKSISVEDSFKECHGFRDAARVVDRLCPDLLLRLQAHLQKYGQTPRTLTVTWRHKESGVMSRRSASTGFPMSGMKSREVLAQACLLVLKQNLKEPFYLSLISLTAKRFHQEHSSCSKSIASYFCREHQKDVAAQASKHGMRIAREGSSKQIDSIKSENDVGESNQDDGFWRDLKECGMRQPTSVTSAKPASYKNEDAAATVKAFQTEGGIALDPHPEGDAASVELAMRLQKEEYDMSASGQAPNKRQRREAKRHVGKHSQKSKLDRFFIRRH